MLWQRGKLPILLVFGFGVLLALGGLAGSSPAAMISYSDVGPVPPGVSFTDIKESSGTDPVPLFGPPEGFSIGLDFDPTSFVATANGGDIDITDGQLNFTVMGDVNLPNFVPINSISLFESGDYTLEGVGTLATKVMAGAIIQATVTQINGIDVAPISLTPSNGSVAFNLVANQGIVQPWSLAVSIDVAGQLGRNQNATKVEVAINNQLLALSEAASVAFIAKKDFRIEVEVPEPTTSLLLLCGCLMWGALPRWHKS